VSRALIQAIENAVDLIEKQTGGILEDSSADIKQLKNGSYRVKLNILIKPKDAEDVKRVIVGLNTSGIGRST